MCRSRRLPSSEGLDGGRTSCVPTSAVTALGPFRGAECTSSPLPIGRHRQRYGTVFDTLFQEALRGLSRLSFSPSHFCERRTGGPVIRVATNQLPALARLRAPRPGARPLVRFVRFQLLRPVSGDRPRKPGMSPSPAFPVSDEVEPGDYSERGPSASGLLSGAPLALGGHVSMHPALRGKASPVVSRRRFSKTSRRR